MRNQGPPRITGRPCWSLGGVRWATVSGQAAHSPAPRTRRLLSSVSGVSSPHPLDVDFPLVISVLVDDAPFANTQPPIIIRAANAPDIACASRCQSVEGIRYPGAGSLVQAPHVPSRSTAIGDFPSQMSSSFRNSSCDTTLPAAWSAFASSMASLSSAVNGSSSQGASFLDSRTGSGAAVPTACSSSPLSLAIPMNHLSRGAIQHLKFYHRRRFTGNEKGAPAFFASFQLVTSMRLPKPIPWPPESASFGAILPFPAKYHLGSSKCTLNITAISYASDTLSAGYTRLTGGKYMACKRHGLDMRRFRAHSSPALQPERRMRGMTRTFRSVAA